MPLETAMNTNRSTDFSQTMLELHEAINALREREEDETSCSFCGKRRAEVSVLVPGPNTLCICDQCVARAARLIGQRT
jgi:hypothetical protein